MQEVVDWYLSIRSARLIALDLDSSDPEVTYCSLIFNYIKIHLTLWTTFCFNFHHRNFYSDTQNHEILVLSEAFLHFLSNYIYFIIYNILTIIPKTLVEFIHENAATLSFHILCCICLWRCLLPVCMVNVQFHRNRYLYFLCILLLFVTTLIMTISDPMIIINMDAYDDRHNNNNNTIFIQVTRFSLMKLLSVWDLLKAKVKFIHEFRK